MIGPRRRGLALGIALLFSVAGFLLGTLLAHPDMHPWPRRMQDPQSTVTVDPTLSLPPLDPSLAEVIEILADYDVLHEGRLMTYAHWYGLTDPNTKTIFINSSVAEDYRAETLLHELLHILYMRRGIDTRGPYEDLVEAKAQELYRQLYGGKN
jgi:hypothetical protein